MEQEIEIKQRQRNLTIYATQSEKRLIEILDYLNIDYDFQKVIMNGEHYYIVDFYFPSINTILEVDGEYHNEENQIKKDKLREGVLKSNGYNIVRITNEDVDNIYAIYTAILTRKGKALLDDIYSKKTELFNKTDTSDLFREINPILDETIENIKKSESLDKEESALLVEYIKKEPFHYVWNDKMKLAMKLKFDIDTIESVTEKLQNIGYVRLNKDRGKLYVDIDRLKINNDFSDNTKKEDVKFIGVIKPNDKF